MSANYTLPWHIRQYVKAELLDFKNNTRLIATVKDRSRNIILTQKRLDIIKGVFDSLSPEDREVAELIFLKDYSQAKAEATKNISKAVYYNTMNKVIFLTAKALELV